MGLLQAPWIASENAESTVLRKKKKKERRGKRGIYGGEKQTQQRKKNQEGGLAKTKPRGQRSKRKLGITRGFCVALMKKIKEFKAHRELAL